MSRSIDLLLQFSTRSWCYSLWLPFWQCCRRTCICKFPHVIALRSMLPFRSKIWYCLAMFWAQHVVLVAVYAMDGLNCVVRLSLTFLYLLLLSANVTLWIPLSSVAVDDVRELLLVLWLLYLVAVLIARFFVSRVRAITAKHVGWLNCLAGNVDLGVFEVSLQSPTSADDVSLQILIHDLVWDLGCSPQTLLIFLPKLLKRWTEVVHDCQHRVSNEIDWVSAGWFHYYGPRVDFCKERRIDLITPFSLDGETFRETDKNFEGTKSSRGGKKAALEMKTVFQIVGGDSATESEVNRTKSQLRRTAIGNVRNKMKLSLGQEPKDFLVLDKNSSWLFEWVHAPGQKKSPCHLLGRHTHKQLIVYEWN